MGECRSPATICTKKITPKNGCKPWTSTTAHSFVLISNVLILHSFILLIEMTAHFLSCPWNAHHLLFTLYLPLTVCLCYDLYLEPVCFWSVDLLRRFVSLSLRDLMWCALSDHDVDGDINVRSEYILSIYYYSMLFVPIYCFFFSLLISINLPPMIQV